MLSKPSKKLAKRILSEVGYDERLEGWRLRERSGMMPVTMYSFTELVALLADPYPRIDLKGLKNWIDNIMADHELERKIEEVLQADASDYEKTVRLRDLAGYRLLQCKKIV